MSIQKCIGIIKAANKNGSITDDAAMEMLEEIDDFITNNKNIDNIDNALAQHIKERFDDTVLAATIEKRNRAINAMVEMRAIQQISAFDNPYEGLKALMGGSIKSKFKSKLSIDAQGKALTNKYIGKLIDRLEKNGDIAYFNSGKFDDMIAKELWEIKPGGQPGITGNAAAKRIAEVIHEIQELAVKNSNMAGSYIRSMPGYIMRQTHDMMRLRKATMDEWINFVWDKLDDTTFKGADKRKFLEGAYKGLASGVHRRFKPESTQSNHLYGFKGPSNLAKKASQERVLHFKDAESFMEYNKVFGAGDLREGIVHGLEHLARNTALMRGLGTNPVSMLDKLKKRYLTEAQKAGNIKVTDQLNNNELKYLLAELDGTTRIPVNMRTAKINATLRMIANVSKLGGATISSITDIANQAAELRYQGKNVFAAYTNAFSNLFRGRGNAEQKTIARSMGIGFDGITGDLMSRFHANDHIAGTGAKLQQKFFKLNLMTWWNDSHRTGMGLMMSNHLAESATMAYKDLGPRLQNVLRQYGIGDAEWSVYSRHGVKNLSDGNKYMVSDAIEELGDAEVAAYLAMKGKPAKTARQINEARDDLVSMLDTFFIDRADHGIPMPGAAERAIMNRGTEAGTATGEMYRHIMQFKSFPITMIRRGMGREIAGQMDGKADIVGLVSLITMSTVFGYGAMYMKDVLKGRSPRTFTDDNAQNAKLIMAALTQGGGLGIYGDFLFGEFSRFGRSALSTAAGPTLGQVDTIAELWTKATRGEDFGATALQMVKDNTPFINLFYTRMALDYLFLYQLQEMVNPGYLSRLEQRIMTENNQRFYMPPSREIPYGGGNKLFEGVR